MGNIIKKIIAFFRFGGEERIVEVNSAEIKENMVYLHPVEDEAHTICIRTESVGITINPEGEISKEDLFLIENTNSLGGKKRAQIQELSQIPMLPNSNDGMMPQKSEEQQKQNRMPTAKRSSQGSTNTSHQNVNEYLKEIGVPAIKRVSFDFYEDDYMDFVNAYKEFSKNIELRGGNRTEFILACTKAAKKTSMESLYKKYHSKHKDIRQKEREARRKAEEELKNSNNEEQAG
ncbi:MAG: hypothetical protein IJA52_00310 [Clostridia bacterium]|nr:hypothetical protein [Clostridia bacterium]